MIKIGERYFELKIIRKKNKNIYLRVKGDVLEVSCPRWVSKEEITAFVISRADWIEKTVNKADKKTAGSKLGMGDNIWYLGKEYPLFVLKGRSALRIMDDKIVIYTKNGTIEEAQKVFYKESAKTLLELIRRKQGRYLAILEDYGYDLEPDYRIRIL